MAIGNKVGSIKALKKTLAKGQSNSAWIRYIPKNSSMNVRFIEEPEEWVNYAEHWDANMRKSYPCNGESTCPGCESDARKSYRYLTNAVDTDSDRVIALQLPKDLANRLVVRYERLGTMTDRDYELSRAGEGMDTVYDLDAGPSSKRNLAKYTPLNLIKVLEDAYAEVFGPDEAEDDDDDQPVKKTAAKRAKTKSAAVAALDIDDDEDDDEEEEEKPLKPKKKKTPAAVAIDEDDDDDEDDDEYEKPALAAAKRKKAAPADIEVDDDDDDEDDDDPDEDDEEVYDEETLSAMPFGALRALARSTFGLNTKGKSQPELVQEILDSGEEVDDEDDDTPPY